MQTDEEVVSGLEDLSGQLVREGRLAREDDLSPEACMRVRAEVDTLLSVRQQLAARAGGWGWKRVVAAIAIPVAASVVACLLLLPGDDLNDQPNPGALSVDDTDVQILSLKQSLLDGLDQFRRDYGPSGPAVTFDDRSTELSRLMASYETQILNELSADTEREMR